ncbi:hypothetical protein KEJ32_00820 [Candidatus Bathyarchaeota archaeon]|nr:hypothetical protein [Candidatus Bathyarchaeota archaeon]MBS7635861.1 hypothetical protein [Candidatus Bathyarchaeota archaeon]
MEKEEDEAPEKEEAEAESQIQVVTFSGVLFLSLLKIRHAYSLLRLAILYYWKCRHHPKP